MTTKRLLTTLAAAAIFIGLGTAAALRYDNSPYKDAPLVYANKDMLQEMWSAYKMNNIEAGSNRTLDKQLDNITTSEGQSYTMLRAVWSDDQTTFDASWKWTKDTLQRDDSLMSWKFGPLADGTYGVQTTVGGENTASDGDVDIALSLLMAYSRWGNDDYLYDALPIIDSIWEKEVVIIGDKPVLVANDIERNNLESVIVNPSYFAPYAYKVFAQLDKQHDWTGLADNSYTVLAAASDIKLDATSSAGLPPDWIAINRTTGAITAVTSPDLTTKFSFDAIRTPWRLALDYAWYQDPRSKQILSKYSLLSNEWQSTGQIKAAYNHDGSVAANYETPATYGAVIGYFKVTNPTLAADIYRTKLSTLYSPDEQKPVKPLGYYDDNWSWFGSALYLDALPNLTAIDTARN